MCSIHSCTTYMSAMSLNIVEQTTAVHGRMQSVVRLLFRPLRPMLCPTGSNSSSNRCRRQLLLRWHLVADSTRPASDRFTARISVFVDQDGEETDAIYVSGLCDLIQTHVVTLVTRVCGTVEIRCFCSDRST